MTQEKALREVGRRIAQIVQKKESRSVGFHLKQAHIQAESEQSQAESEPEEGEGEGR